MRTFAPAVLLFLRVGASPSLCSDSDGLFWPRERLVAGVAFFATASQCQPRMVSFHSAENALVAKLSDSSPLSNGAADVFFDCFSL